MRNDKDGFALTNKDPDHIGPYRLVGKLGAGGMGTVYAGIDSNSERVAIKVIHRELARDPEFRLRFSREVELLNRVHGKYTTRVLAFDVETAQPWLATEYVPGPTLAERIGLDGPLYGQGIVGLAAGLCEALHALHAANIVHRDLKPSNVILSPKGPRVIDMGIARALDETSVTRTGVLVGSPGWISPEEYSGDDVGLPSDIYGWALLLVFASTGRQPFGTGRPEVIATRIMTSDPETDALPEDLQALVRQALSKDPGKRPHADHLLKAMAEICRQSGLCSAAPAEEVTKFLDRTWAVEPTTEPNWSSSEPAAAPKRFNARFWVAASVAATLVGALFATTLTMRSAESRPPTISGDASQTPISAEKKANHTPKSAAPPASRPSPSKRPIEIRRTTPDGSYSYLIPAGWESIVDMGASGGSTCIRPKGSKSCDEGVEITYGGRITGDLQDYDNLVTLELPDPAMFGCYKEDAGASLVERELRRVGGDDAQYRKFIVSCAGRKDYSGYMWVLPNECGQGTNTIRAHGAVDRNKLDSIIRSLSPCPDYSNHKQRS
ncbi:serine/threonine protein kinase [Sphaerimonospora thailandensis]|uniref:Protein kinase domain-containing protein n=1 Tax=Sphaerimonospora thailandensis TaxID=795644 RepID=A0A8J3R620_9ACTN|nr:serine/threonine-protein kinase [Sphaerimonospora thailandensis]GIH68007.1 hypothetical protein Mth01_02600 [Sphaerimonospora thailandensis]